MVRVTSRESIGVSLWIDERSALYQSKIDNATDDFWSSGVTDFRGIVGLAADFDGSHTSSDWTPNEIVSQ